MTDKIKNVVPTKKVEEEAVVPTPQVAQQETPKTVLTGNDAFIAGTVARQPKEPARVKARKDQHDAYDLPPELKKDAELNKKYRFKWVGKSERQITRATEVEDWTLCTRQNASFIPNTYFKVHGAVEKGGMLLAFMRREDAEARNKRLQDKDAARYRSVKEGAGKAPNRYNAKLSPGEETVGGFEQGRDF